MDIDPDTSRPAVVTCYKLGCRDNEAPKLDQRITELEEALLKIFECTYEGDPVKAIAGQALRNDPVNG